MGLEPHGLNLLRYAGNLGEIVTLGRCSNLLTASQLRVAGIPEHFAKDQFADSLLLHLGAKSVESYDNSDFEGATHIADFNKPLPPHRQYDTVIDFGMIEHVYDIAQALKNMRDLCRDGGQILHVAPANNFCGHGFWQISPELFFTLYSAGNGFDSTEVFITKVRGHKPWYSVIPPANGQRAHVSSAVPLFVICRTKKRKDEQSFVVQQSDYLHLWAGGRPAYNGILGKMKKWIRTRPLLADFAWPIYHRFITNASGRNPHLVFWDKRLSGGRDLRAH